MPMKHQPSNVNAKGVDLRRRDVVHVDTNLSRRGNNIHRIGCKTPIDLSSDTFEGLGELSYLFRRRRIEV